MFQKAITPTGPASDLQNDRQQLPVAKAERCGTGRAQHGQTQQLSIEWTRYRSTPGKAGTSPKRQLMTQAGRLAPQVPAGRVGVAADFVGMAWLRPALNTEARQLRQLPVRYLQAERSVMLHIQIPSCGPSSRPGHLVSIHILPAQACTCRHCRNHLGY